MSVHPETSCVACAGRYNLVHTERRVFSVTASMEINCTACRKLTWVRKEPVYEGFKKVGEAYVCTGCGARYASAEETPFVRGQRRPQVFTESDKPEIPRIFDESERQHSCGWCRHFVVNPFAQRCGLTNKETQATDLCVRFEKREPQD